MLKSGGIMILKGRIIKIKKTKNNIFITIHSNNLYQLVVKPHLYKKINIGSLNIGDIISSIVKLDLYNKSKYSSPLESFVVDDLQVTSKKEINYTYKYNVINMKEYADAKYRIRKFLYESNYLEVNIPILTDGETSSKAQSFETIHLKTQKKLFLRKSMDPFLRILSCNDINKIYSIGPCFRNEYVTSKNQSEFEMVSIFTNYMTIEEAIKLSKEIIEKILNINNIKIEEITLENYEKLSNKKGIYIITEFYNNTNSYAKINSKGKTGEFKVRINDITVIHGVEEIDNYYDYQNKINDQGRKSNYGELIQLEKSLQLGAPPCFNLGISIVRILMAYNNAKIKDYDVFAFSRLN